MSDFLDDLDEKTVLGGTPSTEQGDMSDRTVIADRTIIADRTVIIAQPEKRNEDLSNTFHTLRPEVRQNIDAATQEELNGDGFLIKGEFYKRISSLSDNSGEAQIFLVSYQGEEKVLKIYYPNYSINRKLMQTLHNFQFEMIVRLDDFGKTYFEGKHRYFELMEYLKGGTLQEYSLMGNMNQFRRIALQAAASLAFCHKNNILHKDVKPSNFFFRDEQHTQLVLGDFGISSMLESDGKIYRTTQARTPIYAAPASDYYSLGITLFTLWLGENPMSSNERVMMRQKSEGKLPRIDELPERVRRIIQGLTCVNPRSRWKYEEVERWFLGEDVPVDITSPFLKYKSFIVDPDRNLVADNLRELIPMLLDNRKLAINYLYNGRIVSWLENSGNMKLSTQVNDIITNRFPVNQEAGLLAAIYTMDPDYPYYDVNHEACNDIHSVAISLLSNKERYAMELQNPNDSLFLWLENKTKADVDRIRSYFTKDCVPHVAVMRLVYEIDPDVPFLSNHPSASVKEIVKSYASPEAEEDDWHSLVDGRLLSWMYSHEDVMACESLRILIQNQPFSMSLAYKVLYNLDKESAYDLKDSYTPASVGKILSDRLLSLQHMTNEDLLLEMSDFLDPQGRFNYYAQLHGWFQEIADANACFDLKSTENIERLSAYDLHTALYRFCAILGYKPSYQLPNGKLLTCVEDLNDKEDANHIRNEIRTGSLSQWLSVFFHEDPQQDFTEEYSYEQTLKDWVMKLGELDAQNLYYKRFIKAQKDTSERIEYVRHERRIAVGRERIAQFFYYSSVAIWLGLLLFIGIENRELFLQYSNWTILLPVGGSMAVIVAIRSFLTGYGISLSTLFGLIGGATTYLPIYLLKFVNANHPTWFTATLVLLTILYVIISKKTNFAYYDKDSAKTIREILSSEDINTSLLEPLYYTFKTKSYRYKSSKFGLLDDISNQIRSISGESVLHYILWSIMFILMILELCLFSPNILHFKFPFVEDTEVVEQNSETNLDAMP